LQYADVAFLPALPVGDGSRLSMFERANADRDLLMSEVDSFMVIERLHADLTTATVPIIVPTSKQLTPEEKACLEGVRALGLQRPVLTGDVLPAGPRAY